MEELKIVQENTLDFPEVPEPHPLKKKDEDVPELKKSVPEEEDFPDDDTKAPQYIRAQINRIDLLLENNIINEARKSFERLKKYTKKVNLSESFKKFWEYEKLRLETAIKLKEI